MIVRILAEGQWEVDDAELADLNTLDSKVETAVEAGDEEAFAASLTALLDAVRSVGARLPDDSLEDSALILPPADATIEEVRGLLSDEGLIPG
ncbi:MAG: PspA-associated protein PspAA [Nocardioidaceae bacterium]